MSTFLVACFVFCVECHCSFTATVLASVILFYNFTASPRGARAAWAPEPGAKWQFQVRWHSSRCQSAQRVCRETAVSSSVASSVQ